MENFPRLKVPLRIFPHAHGLDLPRYETAGSSGLDLRAAISAPLVVEPGRITLVPTGLAVALPLGFEFQVRPRSGLALRHGIAVLNSPGTVDADYRGELQIILANLGTQPFTINRGDRIAQLVLARVELLEWNVVTELPPSHRGEGGFGHTGV